MTPIRIQRNRSKGWKMPENTKYVGRGSAWGNPFRIVPYSDGKWAVKCSDDEQQTFILTSTCRAAYDTKIEAQADAVKCYEKLNMPYQHGGSWHDYYISEGFRDFVKRELKDKNLACWCKPGEPCHADVLLKIANEL